MTQEKQRREAVEALSRIERTFSQKSAMVHAVHLKDIESIRSALTPPPDESEVAAAVDKNCGFCFGWGGINPHTPSFLKCEKCGGTGCHEGKPSNKQIKDAIQSVEYAISQTGIILPHHENSRMYAFLETLITAAQAPSVVAGRMEAAEGMADKMAEALVTISEESFDDGDGITGSPRYIKEVADKALAAYNIAKGGKS